MSPTISRLPTSALPLIAMIPALAVTAANIAGQISWNAALPLFFVAALWGIVVSTLHWRRLDEAAREAHKFAVFWGAGLGLVLALMALMFLPSIAEIAGDWIEAALARHPDSPMRVSSYGFVIGALYVAVAQIMGFTIYWAFWWIAKR